MATSVIDSLNEAIQTAAWMPGAHVWAAAGSPALMVPKA